MGNDNKDLLLKWKKLATDDLEVAVLANNHGIYLQAAFHCQQSIEKSLKGLIIFIKNIEPPYSHDLVRLYKELEGTKYYDPKISIQFGGLNPYYIRSRYPSYKEDISNSLNKQKINSFVALAKEIEKWLEAELK